MKTESLVRESLQSELLIDTNSTIDRYKRHDQPLMYDRCMLKFFTRNCS